MTDELVVDWDAVYARAAEIDGLNGPTTQLISEVRSAALEEAAKVADAQFSAIDDDPEDYVGEETHSNSWKGCSLRIAAAIRELKAR
jgi:hypothetical protein